jgi:hypothetical protein
MFNERCLEGQAIPANLGRKKAAETEPEPTWTAYGRIWRSGGRKGEASMVKERVGERVE